MERELCLLYKNLMKFSKKKIKVMVFFSFSNHRLLAMQSTKCPILHTAKY